MAPTRIGNHPLSVGEVRPALAPPGDFVSVPAAALETGRPERTLRYWCTRGWIAARQTPGRRWEIARSALEQIRVGAPIGAADAPEST
jgi:hypothetical protein